MPEKTCYGLIKVHLPAAWGHINMFGEYDFSEEKLRDTVDILPPKKGDIYAKVHKNMTGD